MKASYEKTSKSMNYSKIVNLASPCPDRSVPQNKVASLKQPTMSPHMTIQPT